MEETARSGTSAADCEHKVDGRVILDDFTNYPLTDIGSSKLYADMFKNELRFVREMGMYFYYNGKVWIKDIGGVYARRLAKKFAITLVKRANELPDDELRKSYVKYYNKFNGYNAREKLVKDAQTVYLMEYSEFDNKPELYNCQNGTFNLKTGKLQKHSADDMLMQLSNVTYKADAKCERWEKFIDEITEGDIQSKKLLQMIAGYCLSGSTAFECLFILYGKSTRNGKGTFNSTMMKMHGDYSKVLDPGALTAKSFVSNNDSPNESIARLAGARYVCVSEPGKNMVLDTDLIKTLTGGDTIRARFLRQNSFEYVPAFKIVINTNYLPKILDDTVFSSNRLVLLNFNKHFAQHERDNTLKTTFAKAEAISGIFNWCYEGYKMLDASKRFEMPDKSKELFEEYRDESDLTKQFISECLIEAENLKVTLKAVYDEYKKWASENGYKQCSRKTLKSDLKSHEVKIEEYNHQDHIFGYVLNRDDSIFYVQSMKNREKGKKEYPQTLTEIFESS